MKTLVLIEKKSQKEILLNTKLFQNLIENTKFEFIETKMLTPFRFNYPSLKYSDYPYVSDKIDYKLSDPMGYFNLNLYTKEYFSSFDRLIIYPDWDRTGVYAALMLLSEILTDNNDISLGNYSEVIYLKGFSPNIEVSNFNEYAALFKAGHIKKYFEYNYNLNSRIFITEILNYLDLNPVILTKYTVLTFCLIYGDIYTNQTHCSLFRSMLKHKGSGKYDFNEIGSAASRDQIIMNLKNIGLIDSTGQKILKTSKGLEFYNLLNKRFLDIDLPGRLEAWTKSDEDFDKIKLKIDNYLLNLFKLQKRKNKFLNEHSYN